MRFEIDIEPIGAVRTTRKMAGRTKAGQRYAAYKQIIAWKIKEHMKQPFTKAVGVPTIIFKMPIPVSKRGKVTEGQAHTVKPDIDNLIKGLFDSANGVAWIDDNRVAEIGNVKKVYSATPGIIFEVVEVGDLVYGQTTQLEKTEIVKLKASRKEKTLERSVKNRQRLKG